MFWHFDDLKILGISKNSYDSGMNPQKRLNTNAPEPGPVQAPTPTALPSAVPTQKVIKPLTLTVEETKSPDIDIQAAASKETLEDETLPGLTKPDAVDSTDSHIRRAPESAYPQATKSPVLLASGATLEPKEKPDSNVRIAKRVPSLAGFAKFNLTVVLLITLFWAFFVWKVATIPSVLGVQNNADTLQLVKSMMGPFGLVWAILFLIPTLVSIFLLTTKNKLIALVLLTVIAVIAWLIVASQLFSFVSLMMDGYNSFGLGAMTVITLLWAKWITGIRNRVANLD